MKLFLLFIISTYMVGQTLDIGQRIDSLQLEVSDSVLYLIGPSELSLLYSIRQNNVNFRIAIDQNGYIKYIETSDSAYRSPEGLSINTKLADIKNCNVTNLLKISGWGYLLKLSSGWGAVFFTGKSGTDNYPSKNEKIRFFCKGEFY